MPSIPSKDSCSSQAAKTGPFAFGTGEIFQHNCTILKDIREKSWTWSGHQSTVVYLWFRQHLREWGHWQQGKNMGFDAGWILNSQRFGRNRWVIGNYSLIKFTHEGHKGAINDLGWNPYEMILGSAEEDDNTLQFYQIVIEFLSRPITFISWSTQKMWSFSGNSASPEWLACIHLERLIVLITCIFYDIFEEK